jgi:hypothetical protein
MVFYAVEHYYAEETTSTYEIFRCLQSAKDFCKKENWSKVHYPIYIFQANFNDERVYMEDGEWNYDDYGDTIINYMEYYEELTYEF